MRETHSYILKYRHMFALRIAVSAVCRKIERTVAPICQVRQK
jgi:hypothetical protein